LFLLFQEQENRDDQFLVKSHSGHLCVPLGEHAKLIWEAHYSEVAGEFGMEKTMAILQNYFYWSKLRNDVSKYIKFRTTRSITKLAIKKKGMYTHLPTLDRP
jgi:hypothetical protein